MYISTECFSVQCFRIFLNETVNKQRTRSYFFFFFFTSNVKLDTCSIKIFNVTCFGWKQKPSVGFTKACFTIPSFPFIFIASFLPFVFLGGTSGLTRWRTTTGSFPQQVCVVFSSSVCVCACKDVWKRVCERTFT